MITECVDTQAEVCKSIMIDFLMSNAYLNLYNHSNNNLTTMQIKYQILKFTSEPNKLEWPDLNLKQTCCFCSNLIPNSNICKIFRFDTYYLIPSICS